jgi:hypothetical protein
MDRLQRLFGNLPGLPGQGGPGGDTPMVDTAEKVHISSLALLKMLKHGTCLAAEGENLGHGMTRDDDMNRSRRCADGSYGTYAGRIR